MEGELLTEKDERLIKSFSVYEKKMQMLGSTLNPNEAATESLIKSAIPMCEKNKYVHLALFKRFVSCGRENSAFTFK